MAKAYEGNAPFIFISYAHRDTSIVIPVVNALQQKGFLVWYDGGIEAGSEWPEYIAQHLKQSGCVLTFISENFVKSKNCRRELIYAQDLDKPLLNIYIDNVELSDGMKMQLGLNQALWRANFATNEAFISAVCEAKILQDCRAPEGEVPPVEPPPNVANAVPPVNPQMRQNMNPNMNPGMNPNMNSNMNQAQQTGRVNTPPYGAPRQTFYNGANPYTPPTYGRTVPPQQPTPNGMPYQQPQGAMMGTYKKKWISIVLCLLFGALGIHKYYEGKILFGVIYTLGWIVLLDGTTSLYLICLILTIIDLIRLLIAPKIYFVKKGWWRY